MSVEDLKKFGRLCEQDEIVRARVKEIGINDPEGLMAYAATEYDLEYNQDDMMELAKEAGTSQDELSEDDLEKIAGGLCTLTLVVLGGFALSMGVAAGVGAVAGAGAIVGFVAAGKGFKG